MKGQAGFFDLDERYAALSEASNPLEMLVTMVDFELFCHQSWSALNHSDRGQGGRPPYDPVLMFKVLVLQALYNLSDDQAEFQIRDRLSFMRFLGLGLSDEVLDAKTMEKLFARFEDGLRDKGCFAMGGQIVDVTIVEAPLQRIASLGQRRIPFVKIEKSGLALHRKTPRKVNHDLVKSASFLKVSGCNARL